VIIRPRRRIAAAVALTLAGATLAACGSSSSTSTASSPSSGAPKLTTVTLSLDYIANNASFAGFYAAQEKGYFKDAGLEVKIQPYTDTTADVLVNAGKADFGTIDQPSLILDQAAGQKLISIMAIMQHSAARVAVATKDTDSIKSPKDLSGKTFGGFGVPMEKAINDAMIKYDGGTPNYKTITLGVSVYDALTSGQVDWAIPYDTDDIAWAKLKNKAWKVFVPQDYGVPDYYEKMIFSSSSYLKEHPDIAKKFVAASEKGFTWAAKNAAESITIQSKLVKGSFEIGDQTATAKILASNYWLDSAGKVGPMEAARWTETAEFLFKQGFLKDADAKPLTSAPDTSASFTNDYLPTGTS
jgi:ABC-type nitrate/sulfonate/bicarbonate transport system substrate-binding protein